MRTLVVLCLVGLLGCHAQQDPSLATFPPEAELACRRGAEALGYFDVRIEIIFEGVTPVGASEPGTQCSLVVSGDLVRIFVPSVGQPIELENGEVPPDSQP